MTRNFASLVDDNGATILLDNRMLTVQSDHPRWNEIRDALKTGNVEGLESLIDVRPAVASWLGTDPEFSLLNDVVTYSPVSGESPIAFSDEITNKVLSMMNAGANPQPIFNFLRKVSANPSSSARQELLLFCVANGFMIHENGNIIAYKKVREDYTDSYTGKIDNHVGQVVTMERGSVDDRRDVTCSHGLHFAAFNYADRMFNPGTGHLMILSVSPADVVAIPADYDNEKGRCCRYEVIGEIQNRQPLVHREVFTDTDLGIEDEEVDGYDSGYDAGHAAASLGEDYTCDNWDNSQEYCDGYRDGWNDALEALKH